MTKQNTNTELGTLPIKFIFVQVIEAAAILTLVLAFHAKQKSPLFSALENEETVNYMLIIGSITLAWSIYKTIIITKRILKIRNA